MSDGSEPGEFEQEAGVVPPPSVDVERASLLLVTWARPVEGDEGTRGVCEGGVGPASLASPLGKGSETIKKILSCDIKASQ